MIEGKYMPTLNWIGKEAVVKHHKEVPFRLLESVKELSCGDTDSGNLIVQGDNLDALKALLPRYAGQVKCIYIDPPYNTGNENWVYNDNVNSPEIKKWLGEVVGKEGETLDRHDRWLCMMYPRLLLLKQFLTEDGVILVSLDDNEAANAKLLLDEIFNESNFIAQLVWEKGRKNDAKLFSVGHEYIFVYARNKTSLGATKWRAPKDGIEEIAIAYNELKTAHNEDYDKISKGLAKFYKELPKDHPSKKYARAKSADYRGVWRDNNISWPGGGGPKYELIHPDTLKPCKTPDDGWRFIEETMHEKIKDGWVIFRKDHTKPPLLKSYIYINDEFNEDEENEGKKDVLSSVFYRHSQPALDVMKDIFGEKVFPNPKDHEVLAKLIKYVTNNDKNCLILDSFGGSGTTAHSVLELNKSDKGNRKFILVEMDKNVAEKITSKRIKTLCNGYTTKKGYLNKYLTTGFQYCRLSEEPLFNADGAIRSDVTFEQLAEFVWFMETGTGLNASNLEAQKQQHHTPYLGHYKDRAVFLLYNDILNDKSDMGGNVLNSRTLEILDEALPNFAGSKVVYGARTRFDKTRLAKLGITFHQLPYELAVKTWL